MADENNQAAGSATAQPEGLRDVPSDIVEYRKFVADGGHDHNAKIIGREAAEKAAKEAGILPEHETEGGEKRDKFNEYLESRIGRRNFARLQRKIGARDEQITERDRRIQELETRLNTNGANGTGTEYAAAPENNGKPAAVADDKTPPRPKEDDFKTYSEFVEALTDWKTDRKLEAQEAKRREDAARETAENKGKAITDAHNARVDEAKTRYSDWEKVFEGLDDNSFTEPMVVFIFESERGPDITYYLATHRDELEKIRAMSPLRQAAALGKIEDGLPEQGEGDDEDDQGDDGATQGAGKKPAKPAAKAADEDDDKPAKPVARASKAPPPAKPLGGRGAPDDAMPDPKDFAAYSAWSRRQAAKGVKR
jgi:hypothetical protein